MAQQQSPIPQFTAPSSASPATFQSPQPPSLPSPLLTTPPASEHTVQASTNSASPLPIAPSPSPSPTAYRKTKQDFENALLHPSDVTYLSTKNGGGGATVNPASPSAPGRPFSSPSLNEDGDLLHHQSSRRRRTEDGKRAVGTAIGTQLGSVNQLGDAIEPNNSTKPVVGLLSELQDPTQHQTPTDEQEPSDPTFNGRDSSSLNLPDAGLPIKRNSSTSAVKGSDNQGMNLISRVATASSSVTSLVHGNGDASDSGSSQRKDKREQRRAALAQEVRRDSNASHESGEKRSNAARQQQRQMMKAQQSALGLEAELKAQERVEPVKRRSIFRSGTSSTPDLSSLIRTRKSSNKHQQSQPPPTAQNHSGPLGVNSAGSSSTTSLRDAKRQTTQPPPATKTDWDHPIAANYSERQRSMTTIVETPAEPVQRQTSVDSGNTAGSKISNNMWEERSNKRSKAKGMFGRMFGSASGSSKGDHFHHHHGPLTSPSQLSLGGRSNRSQVDLISSPPLDRSPMDRTAHQFASPQFPGNPSYTFEHSSTASAASGAPQSGTNGFSQSPRPPIPQRPAIPIVGKVDHSEPVKEPARRTSGGSAIARGELSPSQESTEVFDSLPEAMEPGARSTGHTRHTSVASLASGNEQQHLAHVGTPPQPIHPGLSRRQTGEELQQSHQQQPQQQAAARSPRSNRQSPQSFSDDVTGLLDRITVSGDRANAGTAGAAAAGVGAVAVLTQEPESAEHLQVPDRNSFPPSPHGSRSNSAGTTYADVSPSPDHHAHEGLVQEALPVPSVELNEDMSREPAVPAVPEVHIPEPEDVPEAAVEETEPLAHRMAAPGHAAAPGPKWDSEQSVIEGGNVDVPTADESVTNLTTDSVDEDEEKGRQLAVEILDDDFSHIPADKVAIFLGGPRAINRAALQYYMQYFDMRGAKLDHAFRDLCAKLHLKAESQEIDRILDAFSARYYECNPTTVFGNPGVVHTVTGAMLMLNTDLHIADLQRHMTRQDFVLNAMRAIRESMPSEAPSEVDVSSYVQLADSSAAQSATSVRLRGPPSAVPSRNASGTVASPVSESTSLASPSTGNLRSMPASTTTVNSFTYTKAWEMEAENALKEIFNNVRNERILLPIASVSERAGGFSMRNAAQRAGMPGLKRSSVSRGSGNSPYNAVFSSSDGKLSPTNSQANSIDSQNQPIQPALGFASNLSHAVIREQDAETQSVHSAQTVSTLEELNDDELALLGAPWAKEGLLQRKIQIAALGRKPQKKDWQQFFVVIQRGDLHMFIFGMGGSSSMGGTFGGGNWMANAKSSGEYHLMHAMAMALPKPGYSVQRPYCFTVTFPNGEISVFQAGTEELVSEWVATCNYWAARRSRQPLVGGVSNIEYGWNRVTPTGDAPAAHVPLQPQTSATESDHSSMRVSRSNLSSKISLNRVVGRGPPQAQSMQKEADRISITEWKPPPHATLPSTLDEEAQLESLEQYVASLKDELNEHKAVEEPMLRFYSPGSKNALKARENWTAKSRYIHSEIFKYETYVEALRNAIASRVQRQGEKKLEKSLARSTVSLHQNAKSKTASRVKEAVDTPPVPAVPVFPPLPPLPTATTGPVGMQPPPTGRPVSVPVSVNGAPSIVSEVLSEEGSSTPSLISKDELSGRTTPTRDMVRQRERTVSHDLEEFDPSRDMTRSRSQPRDIDELARDLSRDVARARTRLRDQDDDDITRDMTRTRSRDLDMATRAR